MERQFGQRGVRRGGKMAKFSMMRDEDDEDEDFLVRSPKRMRTSQSNPDDHQHSSSSSSLDDINFDDNSQSTEEPAKLESMPVFLSDPDVLDCSICFNPLTLPVFQCDNGHVACSSCCTKLENRCPSCCGKIGYNRCRAIEKVIESVRVSCCYSKYGCKETVRYCEKHEHEEMCTYAPCSCPFPNCIFLGSPRRLSLHMNQRHADFVVYFNFDSPFRVSVGLDDKFVVLQDWKDGVLFILSHGNTVAVRCIDPHLSKRRFAYSIVLRKGDNNLRFQSITHSTTGQVNPLPLPVDYVLIPGYFYDNDGCLKLETRIWDHDASHADISQTANDIPNNV